MRVHHLWVAYRRVTVAPVGCQEESETARIPRGRRPRSRGTSKAHRVLATFGWPVLPGAAALCENWQRTSGTNRRVPWRDSTVMVMHSTLVPAWRSVLRAAVLVAACSFAAPVFAQRNDTMTPIATPDQPNAVEIGTAPPPTRRPKNRGTPNTAASSPATSRWRRSRRSCPTRPRPGPRPANC